MMTRKPRFHIGSSLSAICSVAFTACAPTVTEPPPSSFVVLAASIEVNPESGKEFEILTRTFDNLGEYREARIVWWIEPIGESKEQGGGSMPRVTVQADVAGAKAEQPHFSQTQVFGFQTGKGVNVPLKTGPQRISLIGQSETDDPIKVSVAANFRESSVLNLGLNEKDLKIFDNRYLNLHSNMGGLEEVYGVENLEQIDQELSGGMFPFDYLDELRDLFDPQCSITIVDGTEEQHESVEELVRNIGRGHFSFMLQMENTGDPLFEVHPDHAYLRAGRKIHGQKGIGGPFVDQYKWQEEMKIEIRDGRLAITELRRQMEPQEEESN